MPTDVCIQIFDLIKPKQPRNNIKQFKIGEIVHKKTSNAKNMMIGG